MTWIKRRRISRRSMSAPCLRLRTCQTGLASLVLFMAVRLLRSQRRRQRLLPQLRLRQRPKHPAQVCACHRRASNDGSYQVAGDTSIALTPEQAARAQADLEAHRAAPSDTRSLEDPTKQHPEATGGVDTQTASAPVAVPQEDSSAIVPRGEDQRSTLMPPYPASTRLPTGLPPLPVRPGYRRRSTSAFPLSYGPPQHHPARTGKPEDPEIAARPTHGQGRVLWTNRRAAALRHAIVRGGCVCPFVAIWTGAPAACDN